MIRTPWMVPVLALEFTHIAVAAEPADELDAIVEVLKNGDHFRRQDALKMLQKFRSVGPLGARSGPVALALAECLKDRDTTVRHNAAAAFGDIGKLPLPAVMALGEALSDPDTGVRKIAAYSLGKTASGETGSLAAVCLDRLSVLLNDKDYTVRDTAARAMGQIAAAIRTKVVSELAAHAAANPGRPVLDKLGVVPPDDGAVREYPSSHTEAAAIGIAATFGQDAKVRDAATKLAASEDPALRDAGLFALTVNGDTSARDRLAESARRGHHRERKFAIRLLAMTGTEFAKQLLTELAQKDPLGIIQFVASEELKRLKRAAP